LAIALGGWLKQYLKLKQEEIPDFIYGKIFSENVTLGFVLLGGMILG
jgi:4-hydroxybenzoate polyprenyltransferase